MLSKKKIKNVLRELKLHGYSDLGVDEDLDLLSLARQLGSPVPVLPGEPEVGIVGGRSETEQLSPNEYAVVYGGSNIPLHTDAAYYRVPPRLGMLRLKPTSVSNRPTILVDPMHGKPTHQELSTLRRSLWRIYGGGRLTPFAGRIVDKSAGDYYFRFDMNCMRPYFKRDIAGRLAIEAILNRSAIHEIDWMPGQTILWDNWKMLHGNRSARGEEKGKRVLERVLLNAVI